VGFSYSDEEDPLAEGGDYRTDDAIAAKDNYALVQAFLDRFPQYRKNEVKPRSLFRVLLLIERVACVVVHCL
jgi:carboxypeptidase C (cathepsin A)